MIGLVIFSEVLGPGGGKSTSPKVDTRRPRHTASAEGQRKCPPLRGERWVRGVRSDYCDSFTKFGNFSWPSAIFSGQTTTCFSFCHWKTRPVIESGPDLMPWVNSSFLP